MNTRNTIVVSGEVSETSAIRFTPAGLSVLSFTLRHHSIQKEAGTTRKVQAEFRCILIGEKPDKLTTIQMGVLMKVKGFMAPQNAKWPQRLVLHVTAYELMN